MSTGGHLRLFYGAEKGVLFCFQYMNPHGMRLE